MHPINGMFSICLLMAIVYVYHDCFLGCLCVSFAYFSTISTTCVSIYYVYQYIYICDYYKINTQFGRL